jgi:hypothetical protein
MLPAYLCNNNLGLFMDNELILEERITRIGKAVSFAKPDRVPVILEYAGFAAYVTGTSMADFISSPANAKLENVKAMVAATTGK